MLADGDVENVSRYLGRLYSIKSSVCAGLRLGSAIGIPTANIVQDENAILPMSGVYITSTKIHGVFYRSLTSVGTNPTVGVLNRSIIETYIFEFDQLIYETEIEVFFHKRIRGIQRFESLNELKLQIEKDMEEAKRYFCFN